MRDTQLHAILSGLTNDVNALRLLLRAVVLVTTNRPRVRIAGVPLWHRPPTEAEIIAKFKDLAR